MASVCVCGKRRRRDSEQTVQNLEVVSVDFWRHRSFLSSSWLLFPLYSDKFRYVVWLLVFWHSVYFFVRCQVWLIDRPTLQSTTLLFLTLWWPALLSLLHVRAVRNRPACCCLNLNGYNILPHQEKSGWWRHWGWWENLLLPVLHMFDECGLKFFFFSFKSKVWIDQKTRFWSYTPISCFINLPYFIFCPWINKLPEP